MQIYIGKPWQKHVKTLMLPREDRAQRGIQCYNSHGFNLVWETRENEGLNAVGVVNGVSLLVLLLEGVVQI